MKIMLKSIGFIRSKQKSHFGGWSGVTSDLVIDKKYRDALDGLRDYSHLVVIFWMHEVKTCEIRHVPQGKVGEVPEVGIFACRCAHRPNPIGISTVEILGIKDNIVTVKGLDAVEGTPIVDIKPYTPQYDTVVSAKTPDWVNKLDY